MWALLIIPNVFGSTYLLRAGVDLYLIHNVVRNGLLLAIVYTNFLFLIPRFFRNKQYVLYVMLSLLLIAGAVAAMSSLDKANYVRLGFPPLTGREAIQEMIFYAFNMCSYTLTAFLLFSLREKQEQKETLDQVQLEKLGAEIKYLRAQINPHFLFNTLNNLYGLALEKSEKTPEIILKLSKIMDYMLYESNDVKVYLKNDIDNVRNYIDIERIRQGNNAEIRFEVKGEVGRQLIVPLMLLPLVENAFKHGVNTIIDGAYMYVEVRVREGEVEMDVRNNFKRKGADGVTGLREGNNEVRGGSSDVFGDIKPEQERSGIGLANLERRLNLFYPNAHTMTVESTGDDYHVNLKLRVS